MAMVAFEAFSQGLTFLTGDHRQKNVADEHQIERGVGFAMPVPVFPPRPGVAFVVVAIFHRPVQANRTGDARLFPRGKAGEKEAGVALLRRERIFLLRPVAPDRDGRTGSRQPGVDAGNGGPAPRVQPPVFAFLTEVKILDAGMTLPQP